MKTASRTLVYEDGSDLEKLYQSKATVNATLKELKSKGVDAEEIADAWYLLSSSIGNNYCVSMVNGSERIDGMSLPPNTHARARVGVWAGGFLDSAWYGRPGW